MNTIFAIILAAGAMSQNYTLEQVQHNRGIEGDALCRVGLHHRYTNPSLIGERLSFYDFETGGIIHDLLVTDVAADGEDIGVMEKQGIAADTDCEWLVHRHGLLFLLSEEEYLHPDVLRIPGDNTAVARTRYLMRSPHHLCGSAYGSCHWKVERWVWANRN